MFCEELATEVERVEVQQEEVRGDASPIRPQRKRRVPTRLQVCVIILDDMVDNEG